MANVNAWLTPDSDKLTNPLACREIRVSGDLWLYVTGALEKLSDSDSWEQFGSASPDDVAQYFSDVIDDYQRDGVCGMKFIDEIEDVLFDETYLYTAGYQITVTKSFLPVGAQNATAVYLDFRIDYPSTTWALQVVKPSGDARQFLRTGVSGINRFNVICPMGDDGFVVNMINVPIGQSVTWAARLVGWW